MSDPNDFDAAWVVSKVSSLWNALHDVLAGDKFKCRFPNIALQRVQSYQPLAEAIAELVYNSQITIEYEGKGEMAIFKIRAARLDLQEAQLVMAHHGYQFANQDVSYFEPAEGVHFIRRERRRYLWDRIGADGEHLIRDGLRTDGDFQFYKSGMVLTSDYYVVAQKLCSKTGQPHRFSARYSDGSMTCNSPSRFCGIFCEDCGHKKPDPEPEMHLD